MPLYVIYDDITTIYADALVNAANENLTPGGGVCGAIFKGAGSLLKKDCEAVGHCPTGSAIITFAYKLKAKYVIHAVGPIWRGGSQGEPEKLYSCYKEAMMLASTHDCMTVAFPLISSGIYGYPKDEAFHIAVKAIGDYLIQDREMSVFLSNFGRQNMGLSIPERQKVNAYIETGYNIPLAAELQGRELMEFKDWALQRLRDEKLTQEDAAKRANLREGDYSLITSWNLGDAPAPPKEMILQLLTALKADIKDAAKHLSAFGLHFDPQSVKDKIVLYFLENGLTDVFYLNEAVHAFTHEFLVAPDPGMLEDKRKRRR
jgi:O-acetyl-ADP-ribose deacetylase (regulator of RNase III)